MKRIYLETFSIIFLALASFGNAFAQQNGAIEDKDVTILEYEDVAYPHLAITGQVEGIVVVRLSLDEQGKVLDATALSGTPLLIKPSIENAKKMRLAPNSQKGAVIVYNFRVQGECYQSPIVSQTILYPPNLLGVTGCRRQMLP